MALLGAEWAVKYLASVNHQKMLLSSNLISGWLVQLKLAHRHKVVFHRLRRNICLWAKTVCLTIATRVHEQWMSPSNRTQSTHQILCYKIPRNPTWTTSNQNYFRWPQRKFPLSCARVAFFFPLLSSALGISHRGQFVLVGECRGNGNGVHMKIGFDLAWHLSKKPCSSI